MSTTRQTIRQIRTLPTRGWPILVAFFATRMGILTLGSACGFVPQINFRLDSPRSVAVPNRPDLRSKFFRSTPLKSLPSTGSAKRISQNPVFKELKYQNIENKEFEADRSGPSRPSRASTMVTRFRRARKVRCHTQDVEKMIELRFVLS